MSNKKRYSEVSEMVRDLTDDETFADELDERLAQRQIVKRLFALRSAKGLSQKDIADRLACTQSRVSKLEGSKDVDLRLGDLAAYAEVLGLDVTVTLGKKGRKPVDEVKHHAFCIKKLLDDLAHLAMKDDKIAEGVSNFFGEAVFNLCKILQDSANKLPLRPETSAPYIRIEMHEDEQDLKPTVGERNRRGKRGKPTFRRQGLG